MPTDDGFSYLEIEKKESVCFGHSYLKACLTRLFLVFQSRSTLPVGIQCKTEIFNARSRNLEKAILRRSALTFKNQ
jgi:hypothetical protein